MTALGLVTAGCAGIDGTAQPMSQARIAIETDGTDRQEFLVRAQGGDTIALTAWLPEKPPRAIVLAVHGYGDYGPSTFDTAARHWAALGIATYAYDQRGFGRNPSNGVWPGHEALIADLGELAALVRARHPGVPVTLLGHSMGGAVVVAALGEGRVEADSAVLLAPALWGGPYLNPFLRALAFSAALVSPDKRWSGDGIVKIQASDNIPMLRALGRDPLYVAPPSSREFAGLIRLMDRAYRAAPSLNTPILLVYGAKDEVVPEEPLRAAFDTIPAKKRFDKVETGWHMLLRDLNGQAVWDLTADYVLSSAS